MIRFLFSMSTFAVTMVLGLVAFAYTALNHPATLNQMHEIAESLRSQILQLGLSDSYKVFVNLLLKDTQIVILGFTLFIRLVIGIVVSVLSGGHETPQNAPRPANPSSNPNSPFSRWG